MYSLKFGLPSQKDTAAWARMLAAARFADNIPSDDAQQVDEDPLTRARLGTLLPIARRLYDDKVVSIALSESQKIGDILKYCAWLLRRAGSSRRAGRKPKLDAAERWDEKQCLEAASNLMFPRKIQSLQPVSPNVVGYCMIPNFPAWGLLRSAMRPSLSKADERQAPGYILLMHNGVALQRYQWDEVQPLRNVRFVDEVCNLAPALVVALPPRWTSLGMTDELLEALLALLDLGNTRPLDTLVKMLSKADYDDLVREHWCLSQVLDHGDWKPDCANERSLGDYKEFVRILRLESGFKGSLAEIPANSPVPVLGGQTIATVAESEYLAARCEAQALASDKQDQIDGAAVGKVGREPQYPPQTNAVAWARMMAAARGADKIQTDGKREIRASPLTKARVHTLFPVTRELYDEKVVPTAKALSERIDALLRHCAGSLPQRDSSESDDDLSKPVEPGPAEPWDKQKCEDEADSLLVPFSLATLRPMSPNAMGFQMIPNFSAWRLLRSAILETMLPAERRQKILLGCRICSNIRLGVMNSSVVQPLHNVRFVDAVRKRAPALVGALPSQWTSPGITDELLEALQALLKLSRTRPLAQLVSILSHAEYNVLKGERTCLSQILARGTWSRRDCAKGRRLLHYTDFAHILRQDGNFKGSLEIVPPKSHVDKTPAVVHRKSDAGRGGGAKRQRSDDAPTSLEMLCEAAAELERTTRNDESPAPMEWEPNVNGPFTQSLDGNGEPFTSLHLLDSADPAARVKRQRTERLFQLLRDHGRGVSLQGRPSEPLVPMCKPLPRHRVADPFAASAIAAPISEKILPLERTASHALARSDSATAVSNGSVSLFAATGAVAVLALVLFFAVLVFRQRPRRVSGGRTRASAEQL